jgi:hypothetical protein
MQGTFAIFAAEEEETAGMMGMDPEEMASADAKSRQQRKRFRRHGLLLLIVSSVIMIVLSIALGVIVIV